MVSVPVIVCWKPGLYWLNFCCFITAVLAQEIMYHIIVSKNVSLTSILCPSSSASAKVDRLASDIRDCSVATCKCFNTIICIILFSIVFFSSVAYSY